MKVYKGRKIWLHPFLTSAFRLRWMVNITPWPDSPWDGILACQCLLNRRLNRPHSQAECFETGK
jgi:hypothetical protein